MTRPLVAKVGGSLFDLPDLRDRLTAWLTGHCHRPVVLIPGGGAGADVIRRLDAVHRLGEEAAHWLALRVMTVNASFLARLLRLPVMCSQTSAAPNPAVLDAHEFWRANDGPAAPRHSWQVTSDTIAAWVACHLGADLVLLKSADLPAGIEWEEAAVAGLVDTTFPELVRGRGLSVSWVNLRGPASPRQ
jgi:aspartokinase-like uncharacterized kinase